MDSSPRYFIADTSKPSFTMVLQLDWADIFARVAG
jgi:hypothetical protein